VFIIKFGKVPELFPKRKVRTEQLWFDVAAAALPRPRRLNSWWWESV